MRRHLLCILLALSFCANKKVHAQDSPIQVDSTATFQHPDAIEQADTFLLLTSTAPVAWRKASSEKLAELKNSDDYWYANLAPKKNEPPKQDANGPGKTLFDSAWFRSLLWIIILCSFIAVVIWYLASSNVSLFRKGAKKLIEEAEDDTLGENIFAINYEKEIEKAAIAGNYRLAVRLWYLRTLKELAGRNLIAYRHERTNSDYVASLYNSRYYRDFFRLTRNFEYTWYGGFALSGEAYDRMQAEFQNFKSTLS